MKKIPTVVMMLAIVTLTGCRTQTGGIKGELLKIDDNGFTLASLETNGFHSAAGADVDAASEEFNRTIQQKQSQQHAEDIGKIKSALTKKLVNADVPTADITILMDATFGPSSN